MVQFKSISGLTISRHLSKQGKTASAKSMIDAKSPMDVPSEGK